MQNPILRGLRCTTSLTLVLALALPFPTQVRAQDLPECVVGGELPCQGPDGEPIETLEELLEFLLSEPSTEMPDADVLEDPEPEIVPEDESEIEPVPELEAVPELEPVPELELA
jgi:hypothetical protein